MINEGESNWKLSKMFASKNLRMTQKKASSADLFQKAWSGILKKDGKIILSRSHSVQLLTGLINFFNITHNNRCDENLGKWNSVT